jgi:hypothetical protein
MFEGDDAQGIDSVFVLGNGLSRKNIDISKLDGTVIGCNACYRDFTPDVICATDAGIIGDIIESGYDGQCYFTHNSWNLLPEEAYNSLVNGTEHATYRRFDSEYFVYISGLAANCIETKSYIIWVPKGMENKIKNMNYEYSGEGQSTGAAAVYVACRDFTCNDYEKVYLLGFDHKSNKYDNLYANTPHYYNSDYGSWKSTHEGWTKELLKIMTEFPALQFVWVNYRGDDFPKLPNLFSKDETEIWQA